MIFGIYHLWECKKFLTGAAVTFDLYQGHMIERKFFFSCTSFFTTICDYDIKVNHIWQALYSHQNVIVDFQTSWLNTF